ncbi:tRNA 2-selenouridine(34) synthase MnmH [Marinicauda algicola]|uniref:tRNA 2-selenouridine(34) synthase MnmH n=1 Tax=Marinicauda algicola TaxID=2029849 RepID=A0A4S2H169_9PROT|nr:tRNA 2-selenouridine(34) synthase MnmH [Marinicauda algicola]TGY89226.1 tRNA 2-selenouridine(34) synthase MnmH [Marinicauda algicola]
MRDPVDQFDKSVLGRFDDIIDVRSPAEFEEDHVPGAVNLPVLDDEERARVGTIYKQVSRFEARRLGAALVAKNIAGHLETALADKPAGYSPLIYCWRGGQRSGSMALIMTQVGWPATTLKGGYKTYRAHVQHALYEGMELPPVILLDGNTGTGKTALLPLLEERGVQALDLEAIACHRGSIFGGLGLDAQPSQKGFESRLWHALSRLDTARPVVIEAESSKVGLRSVPPVLWKAMEAAPRIEISAPPQARADHLVAAYPELLSNPERLEACLTALKPLVGGAMIEEWRALAGQGRFADLARGLMETHYDPAYARSRARIGGEFLATLDTDRLDADGLARLADRVAEVVKGWRAGPRG